MGNNDDFLYDIGDIVELRRQPGQEFEIIGRSKMEEPVVDMITGKVSRRVFITYTLQKVGSTSIAHQCECMQGSIKRLIRKKSVFIYDERSVIDQALDRLNVLDEMYRCFGDAKYQKLKNALLFALQTGNEKIIREHLEEIEFFDKDDN